MLGALGLQRLWVMVGTPGVNTLRPRKASLDFSAGSWCAKWDQSYVTERGRSQIIPESQSPQSQCRPAEEEHLSRWQLSASLPASCESEEPNERIYSGGYSKEGLAIPKSPEGEDNYPSSDDSQEGPPGGSASARRGISLCACLQS